MDSSGSNKGNIQHRARFVTLNKAWKIYCFVISVLMSLSTQAHAHIGDVRNDTFHSHSFTLRSEALAACEADLVELAAWHYVPMPACEDTGPHASSTFFRTHWGNGPNRRTYSYAITDPPPAPGPGLASLQLEKLAGTPQQCDASKGNPCNAANGNKYQTESDYVGGEGVPSFVRHYNSLLASKDYGLGYGWTALSLKRLELYGTTLQVREADGRGEPFTKNASGQWVGDADTKITLVQNTSGYVLTRQDGSVERYDTAGKLVSETDRNGRTTSYSYNGSGKLASLSGPFGHALSFGYDGNGRISSVTGPAGGVYGYGYDTQGNLNKVAYPDGTFRLYHYETASLSPVSWWPGEGDTDDIADSNPGVSEGSVTYTPGKVGQAFMFNGSSQVRVSNTSNLRVSHGEFTVEAWVRFDALGGGVTTTPGDMSLLDTMTGANADGWRLIKQADNRFWFCFGAGSNHCGDATYTIFSTTRATTGGFYHVAVVKTATQFAIYVNGNREDIRALPASFTDTQTSDLLIGGNAVEGAHVIGLIDEPKIYNRALSSEEIQAVYANPHRLTGITDERGVRFSTYAYDTNGKAIVTQHAVTTNVSPQERFSFTYNSDTQTTVTDPVGNQEVMTFGVNLGVKNLTSKLNQGDGKALSQTFDAGNNLTCKKDEEGRVTTYTYNATNQRLTQTEGQGGDCASPVATSATRTTTYQYLSSALVLPTVIESPSVAAGQTKKTEIAYSNNLPTQITQRGYTPQGNSISRTIALQYDSQGRVTQIDGPRTDVSDITTLEYNNCSSGSGCGQLKTLTNSLNQVTTFNAYDSHGRLTESTDPNGLKTNYAYDLRNRVLSVTQTPSGGSARITQYSYDPRGNVASTTGPDGRVLTYIYDAANYLTSVTDNLNNKVEYGYDLKGNRTVSLTKDPDGSLVRNIQTAYDLRNRASQVNNAGSLTSQVFDALGNLTTTQDPNGNPTSHQYDSLNRLLQTVDALSGITAYGYDRNDRLNNVQAPNGATTGYETDDLGNLLKEVSPDRGTLVYTHDEAGNVKSVTDARNITTQYAYDALNRVTGMDYPGTDEDVALTYDSYTGCTNGIGRLCKVQDQSGTTEYAYDGFGNVSQVTRTELGVSYVTRYTYDNTNRIASITYPDGRTVTYARDTVGRISGVSMTVNGTTTTLASGIAYRADNLIKNLTYGNGLTEGRLYNLKGELTDQALGSETHNYSYDLSGNLTQAIRANGTSLYTFDALDRLINETSASIGQLGYGYDPNGNRLSFIDNGETKTYSYSPNTNRLTQIGHKDVILDAVGNTISDTKGKRIFEYLPSGRLFKVYKERKLVATYLYNVQGQRTQKITKHGTTVYHHDLNGHLIAETSDRGVLQRAYVWLNDLPFAQIDRHGKGEEKSKKAKPAKETVAYLHTDHLGTPRLATDSTQAIVWRWDSDAFGTKKPDDLDDEHEDDDHEITVNHRNAGQYFDKETGLFYNWNRYYNPRTGRYISFDPIGIVPGLGPTPTIQNYLVGNLQMLPLQQLILLGLNHPYVYANSNPLRFTDPFGLQSDLGPADSGDYSRYQICPTKPVVAPICRACIDLACKLSGTVCCTIEQQACYGAVAGNSEKENECRNKFIECLGKVRKPKLPKEPGKGDI